MELMIPFSSQGDTPLYEQIYEHIKKEIRTGGIRAGSRLPSTRGLAKHLRVSRSTTQMAYEQLLSEGYIEASPCRGYFVLKIDEMQDVREDGAWCGGQRKETLLGVSESEEQEDNQDPSPLVIDFSPRGIDLTHFPYNAWRKVTRNTLVEDKKELFLTGSPQGEPAFREVIRQYLYSARGVQCSSEQILIGAGSEYLLMLLSRLLGQETVIAMENPTYRQAFKVLESQGHPMVPVEMDASGMSVTELERSGAGVAYIMPSHQYPMGIVMPVKRRQEILSWAEERPGRYVIEDDYDSEFRYRGKPIPAMQGMDRQGKVIYMGTFSKSIAPAIRVGYLVLPPALLERYRRTMGFFASTVSRIDQNILQQFLQEGYYERHLNRMRAIYRSKHDVLMSQMKKLEADFSFQGEYAGLHVLLTSKKGRGEEWLIEQAGKAGVQVYGLSACRIEKPDQRAANQGATVILGYANLSEDQIREGIRRLIKAWEVL